jgi:hypothetical protein
LPRLKESKKMPFQEKNQKTEEGARMGRPLLYFGSALAMLYLFTGAAW